VRVQFQLVDCVVLKAAFGATSSAANAHTATATACHPREREFFIDNLPVRIHFIIVMIRWTGLAPWDFEFPFPGRDCLTCAEFASGTPSHLVVPRRACI